MWPLNKISGEWDNDKLALLIADLQGADFDVSLTGFDPEELEDLFQEDTKKGVQDDDFNVDAELAKPTFSKAGDLWLLGDHRLVCGDSTKPETYELLMNGKQANLVITDPRTMSITKVVPVRLRMTIWKTASSISSCLMPTLACMNQWQMMPPSTFFTQIPKASTSVGLLPMLVLPFWLLYLEEAVACPWTQSLPMDA